MTPVVNRSAHRPPHHARSPSVAKHQTEAEGSTAVYPAAWAHPNSRLPASQWARLIRVSSP